MAILVLVLLVSFVLLGMKGHAMNKRLAGQKAQFAAAHEGWQGFIADTLSTPTLLALDATNRLLVVGTLESHVEVAWSAISSVEIENNGASLTTTNRGSQLLGGVVGNALLGPMGLLIGGLTGSKSTHQRVNNLALKITIEHPSSPSHRVISPCF